MLRNWKNLSEESYESNNLKKLFHASSIEQHLQKIFLLKYCLEKENEICKKNDVNVEEIDYTTLEKRAIKKFESIVKENELEKEEIDLLLREAKKRNWPKVKNNVVIFITRKEIEFINRINATREFKLFILGLVIYGKFMRKQKGLINITSRDKSYIYYLMTQEDDYNVGKQRGRYLTSFFSKPGVNHGIKFFPHQVVVKGKFGTSINTLIGFKADWIEWDADEGYCIVDLDRDSYKLGELITDWIVECPVCGNEFIKTTKSKTDLCGDCYTRERRKNKTLSEKNRRKNKGCGQETQKN